MIKEGNLVCVWCGKRIPSGNGWKEFCSDKCEDIAASVRGLPKPVREEKEVVVEKPARKPPRRIITRSPSSNSYQLRKARKSYHEYIAGHEKHQQSMLAKYGAPVGAKPPQPSAHRRKDY